MVIRGEFFLCIGFVLVVVGLVVGLGNIWGFLMKVVSNGGVVFVLVYFLFVFVLVYLVLMVEFIIGWSFCVNMVDVLGKIFGNFVGWVIGLWGCVIVFFIFVFYVIVGGWMLVYFVDVVVSLFGLISVSEWLFIDLVMCNVIFCFFFMVLMVFIVVGGVKVGIEKWFVCLMFILVFFIIVLIVYVSF